MRKKALSIIATLCLALAACCACAQSAGNFTSLTPVFSPAAASFTASGSSTLAINGLGVGVVTIKGTFTGMTVNIQGANDNATFSSLQLLPVGGGVATTAPTSTGVFFVSFTGMTQTKIVATCSSCTGTVTIKITGVGGGAAPLRTTAVDPCQDPSIPKVSALVTGTAPNAAVVIAVAAGKNIWVCDFDVTTGTAATSVQLKAGTQTTNPCDTGAVALTGAIPVAVGTPLVFGWGGTIFGPDKIPVSNQFCVFVAGGTAVYAGSVTFVQM